MSRTTKKKHVFQEMEDPDCTLEPGQEVAKVEASRGNNLHEVTTADNERFLASMPSRFRRNVWIKRGDYVIIERISEGVKVRAEIVKILFKDHIEQMKKDGTWPSAFELDTKQGELTKESGDDDLFVNTNRRPVPEIPSDSSEEDSNESGEDEEESDNEDDVDEGQEI